MFQFSPFIALPISQFSIASHLRKRGTDRSTRKEDLGNHPYSIKRPSRYRHVSCNTYMISKTSSNQGVCSASSVTPVIQQELSVVEIITLM